MAIIIPPASEVIVSRTLLALLLAGSISDGAPVPKEFRAKPPTLDGRWRIVEWIACGLDLSNQLPMEWEVRGATLSMFERSEKGTFDIPMIVGDPALSRPGGGGADEIDFVTDTGDIRRLMKGRVAWVGGELLLAFGEVGEERPAEVKAGPAVYFYRLKRVPAR